MSVRFPKSVMSAVMLASCMTAAKADTLFSFPVHYSTTEVTPITVTGSIGTNYSGFSSSSSATGVDDWTLNFSTQDPLVPTLTLNPGNSTFTIAPNTTTYSAYTPYTNILAFVLDNANEGFTVDGTATVGADTFEVNWAYGVVGPLSVINIKIPDQDKILTGVSPLTFPTAFQTEPYLQAPSPVPEPSSLLLIGTGTLSALASFRRFRRSGE